jgi:hypothetical protein
MLPLARLKNIFGPKAHYIKRRAYLFYKISQKLVKLP